MFTRYVKISDAVILIECVIIINDVIIFNRVHSLKDVIFSEELASLEKRSKGRVRVITMTSKTEGDWPESLNLLDPSRGVAITAELVSSLIPDIHERDTFLCGPESFMADVKACLTELGYNVSQLHAESFIGLNNSPGRSHASVLSEKNWESHSVSREAPSDIPPELQCEVQFKRTGTTVICHVDDNLLDLAEFYGVEVANSCRMGSCGSCKCVKISGEVQMRSSNGLTEAQRMTQHILLCVSHAKSKSIVLDL